MMSIEHGFLWVPDRLATNIREMGFWRFLVFRGLARFAAGGALVIALVGLWSEGATVFVSPWWHRSLIAVLVGGAVWSVAVWWLVRLKQNTREVVCWLMAIGILVFAAVVILK